MNEFLKLAFEEGQQRAEAELDEKLKAAIKKREALVGWKEQPVAPARLNLKAK